MQKLLFPGRFYSLDVLRGLAALSVVLWHWQHFFLPLNKQGVKFSADQQPLFESLFVLYKYGYQAVELFFCISGFIFFWLYSKKIGDGTISLRSFSVLRLSRLYPLHFATLVFVAFGQFIYSNLTAANFTYPFNDTYHFLLNLFFVSSWGFQKGYSFNYPIWSVSVELLLYAMFFVFCRVFEKNIIAVIFAIIFGHFLMYGFNREIASGIESFFIGGLVFITYEQIVKTGYVRITSIWLPLVVLAAWVITLVSVSSGYAFVQGEHSWIVKKIISNWVVFVLFPLTILSLALIETKKGTFGKRLSMIGDISYSSYLLHFPLQLAVAIVVVKLAINQDLYYSPWFLILFYLALILISVISHRFFEVPIQRFLRLRYS